jgi:hypothetical protein
MSSRTSTIHMVVLVLLLCLSANALSKVIEKRLPPGPELYRPETDNSILEKSVTLQWQYFENANLFRIQAAFDREFNSLFLDDTSPYHFYMLHDLPRDGSRIFWRVRACNLTAEEENPTTETLVCLSEWSKAYTFYSGIPAEEGEEDTNFFRRVFGCERIDEEDSLMGRLAGWLPFLISLLIILQIRTPKAH